jgi:hypothetical protein
VTAFARTPAAQPCLGVLLAIVLSLASRTVLAQGDAVDAESTARSGEFRHLGHYAALDGGGGAFWLRSQASASNGFRQPIPSTVFEPGWTVNAGLGMTLPRTSIVVGARAGLTAARNDPVVESRGHRLRAHGDGMGFASLEVFARYFLDVRSGFFLGGSLGHVIFLSGVTAAGDPGPPAPESDDPLGVSLAPEVGYEFRIKGTFRAGFVGRTTVAYLFGEHGTTLLVVPVALASLTFH